MGNVDSILLALQPLRQLIYDLKARENKLRVDAAYALAKADEIQSILFSTESTYDKVLKEVRSELNPGKVDK